MSSLLAPERTTVTRSTQRLIAEQRFAASIDVPTRFFEAEADRIARACLEMARRFNRGGRLLVFGESAAATDAHHVAVEFVHPVLVGKRALPALAVGGDVVASLAVLGRDSDIALGIAGSGLAAPLAAGLAHARAMEMLTIALVGAAGHPPDDVDFVFAVPTSDTMLVQEVHEMTYHVLWELVHVFLDHGSIE